MSIALVETSETKRRDEEANVNEISLMLGNKPKLYGSIVVENLNKNQHPLCQIKKDIVVLQNKNVVHETEIHSTASETQHQEKANVDEISPMVGNKQKLYGSIVVKNVNQTQHSLCQIKKDTDIFENEIFVPETEIHSRVTGNFIETDV